MLKHGLTICIPALNEELSLAQAVQHAKNVASRHFSEWEILVFNDGSTDSTGRIAEELAATDPRVWAFHHIVPRNVGTCYSEAIEYARFRYLILVPGDDENPPEGMDRILALAGTADLVIPFTENPGVRTRWRRLASDAFTRVINLLAGTRVRYFNGTVLQRVDLLRSCGPFTPSFGYQAELILKLLRRGHTYREVAIPIRPPAPGRRSKAFRIRNLSQVLSFLLRVALEGLFSPGGATKKVTPTKVSTPV